MNNIEKYEEKTFESIKHIDEYGNEFWEARELMSLLEYRKWKNFHKVIKNAWIPCKLVIIRLMSTFLRSGKWSNWIKPKKRDYCLKI